VAADHRDRGELVGYYASSVGVLLALGLTMLKYDYFWIANVLYLSFVIAGAVSAAVKLVAYRRGFERWSSRCRSRTASGRSASPPMR
jgi:hypothetical protein